MDDTLFQALALIPALVIAIVFHEVAHGWTALMLGDPTAKQLKRLSLNPIRHVDPFGTLILPGLLALSGLPLFGWAKPVPVVKQRLRNPRFGMMAVAAAGPGTNLVLAAIGAVLLGLLLRPYAGLQDPGGVAGYVATVLINFLWINVFLALFNLLPIPPFDGSHIVEGLLPERAAGAYEKLRPFGFILIFGLLLIVPMVVPSWDIVDRFVLPPVIWVEEQFMTLTSWIAGG
jgi:Zn-dependent protease